MTWLKVISLLLQGVTGLVAFLRDRQLLAAGEAQQIVEALGLADERVKTARAARQRTRDSNPDPDDPYVRD